jgi:hypothetical protein
MNTTVRQNVGEKRAEARAKIEAETELKWEEIVNQVVNCTDEPSDWISMVEREDARWR